jgi:hypothetical protein
MVVPKLEFLAEISYKHHQYDAQLQYSCDIMAADDHAILFLSSVAQILSLPGFSELIHDSFLTPDQSAVLNEPVTYTAIAAPYHAVLFFLFSEYSHPTAQCLA